MLPQIVVRLLFAHSPPLHCLLRFIFCTNVNRYRYTLTFNWLPISIQYFVHKIQSLEHEHMHCNLISNNDSLTRIIWLARRKNWLNERYKTTFTDCWNTQMRLPFFRYAIPRSLWLRWLFSIIIYDSQIRNIHNFAISVNKVGMAVINSCMCDFSCSLKCRNLKFMYVFKLRHIFS